MTVTFRYMGLQAYLTLAAVVFCIGLFGVITRRNTIGILLGIELMLNAVNINLVAFSRFSGDVTGMVFTRLHHLHHRGGGGARPGDRHSALPHPPHRDGGSPGPAQGMMTDAGTLAARRAAAATRCRSWCWRSSSPLRRLGRPAAWFSILCAAGSLAAAVMAWRRTAASTVSRLVWDWLPSQGQTLATVGVLADADSTIMLMLVALVAFLVQLYSLGYLQRRAAGRRSAATTPTSRCSRSR